MQKAVAVEIAVQDPAGVRIALDAGVDRVELCSALGIGGLTPSAGLLAAAVARARAADRSNFVHMLVRPRGGGFVYASDEVDVMIADIRGARASGAGGVVVGALDRSGAIDVDTTARLIEAADGMEFTFHRAMDAAADPLDALETLIELGVRRILTSGGAARSIDGVGMLTALAAQAAGRIQVMAGGGVRVPDLPAIAATGVDAVHLSARASVTGTVSGPGGGDDSYDVTSPDVVRDALSAVCSA
ncbi:copper homeostasis protein CutC [Leifsonia poae]|uniref:copper homeostasis protein CutC n=1 Tax=Leifsonia poae TaxID=110933 RepID=UPI001CC12F60|nr:copper homeostasis protein CutC [Leifsonia poae]